MNINTNLPVTVPSGSGTLTTTTGPQRIATRMAENLLGVARSQERALAAQRRYRIGDYEFREADHAQIQRWARKLGMEPEAVVERLASSQKDVCIFDAAIELGVQDGAIVSLVWDFALLPLTDWVWGPGLQIGDLGILNAPSGPLPPLPDCLYGLSCYDNPLTSLTLPHAPQLQFLMCFNNQLTELNLTPVPRLEMLGCDENQLTTLDLTPVPGLQDLWCSHNELTILNLTPVPNLHRLYCTGNPLTELDLTPVPDLQNLWCDASVNITGAPPNLKVYRL
ncbi:MAG: hypothetical protein ACMV16_10840 [Macromonas sp.]